MKNSRASLSSNKTAPLAGGEIKSFADVTLVVANHIKVIFLLPIVFCSITILYLQIFGEPVYVSSSKILSSSGGGHRVTQAAGIAAQFGINFPTNQSEPKWVYPEIIKSRMLAKKMLKQKYDTDEFGPQKTLLQILTYGNEQPKFSIDTLEILAVDAFLKLIDVSENVKTGIVKLSIESSEPKLAAKINRSLISQLDLHQKSYNREQTSETRKFIEERILEVERELMSAEENLKTFMDRNRRIENSPSLQLEKQRLSREVTVLTGVFTTLKQQLETTKIQEFKDSDYVTMIDPPEIPLQKSKPKKMLIVVLVGIFSAFLGLFLAFVLEFFAKSKKEEKEKIMQARLLVKRNLFEIFGR